MGELCKQNKQYAEAENWYLQSLDIFKNLFKETNTDLSRRDLSLTCSRLGNLCRVQGRDQEAESWYRKAREVKEASEGK